MNREEFIERFSPEALNKIDDNLELLKQLVAPKTADEKLMKNLFGDDFTNDFISLKNALEHKFSSEFGKISVGSNMVYELSYSVKNDAWYIFNDKVSIEDAKKRAVEIKNKLLHAYTYLKNNNFNDFYNYLKNDPKTFDKVYMHKYFTILFPQYITTFHAKKYQKYYKDFLGINDDFSYEIEKYILDKNSNANMQEESKKLENKYGRPPEYDKKKTWLLTWNPNNWEWKTFEKDCNAVKNGIPIEDKYSCHSKDPKIGDRAFVLKLGENLPKGIIASGYVVHEPYDDMMEHANKTGRCIKIKFDRIINFNKDAILSQDILRKKIPTKTEWSPRSSGTEIKKEDAKKLEDLWKNIKEVVVNPAESKYWLYQPGPGGDFWDEFYSQNIIAICWDELGDLKQYNSEEELAEKITEIYSKKSNPDKLANWEFANVMNIGDIVYVKKGDKGLIGRGIVQSDYCFDDTRSEYKSVRKIHWTHKGNYNVDMSELGLEKWPQKTLTNYSKDFCLKIEDIFMNNNKNEQDNIIPLNQILYGPPGTGKTYNTIVEAIKILDKDLYEKYKNSPKNNDDYKELRDRYNQLKKLGQIEFVTFHQSYSYEEFVEGIKPDLDVSELKYIREDGIFKRICDNAGTKVANDFEKIYAKFIEEFDENYEFKTSKSSFKVRVNEKDGLTIRTGENFDVENSGTITKEQIKNQTYTSEGRRIKLETITKYLQDKYDLKFNQNKQKQPYVLIIDEINRGNISKIFGELITLIEEDKRENMSVKLPYSQETFTVPKNLYIIGTMNTSDRSIASIDIALRRRFIFKEMMPDVDLVPNIDVFGQNLQKIFTTLNERISVLLDRDHQIGHSYFMKLKESSNPSEDFKRVWYDCIMPLLNEYFYGDWEKLCALLGEPQKDGKSFIRKTEDVAFATSYDCDDDDKYDFVTESDINFQAALENAFLQKKAKVKDESQENEIPGE